MRKLKNEDIDKWLLDNNKSIKWIDNYINSETQIKFKCLKKDCNNIWPTIYRNLIKCSGCPKCARKNKKRETNKSIDQWLLDNKKLIKRIDNITENRTKDTKIKFQCLKKRYGFIWPSRIDQIKSNHGCPKCAGNYKIDNGEMDRFILANNIQLKRIGVVINNSTPIEFQCLKKDCGYIYLAAPTAIRNHNSGCHKCAGNIHLSNNDIDQWLLDNKKLIRRIDNYINSGTKILWQCLNEKCKNFFPMKPNAIKSSDQGCPKCCVGIGKNAQLILKYLIDNNYDFKREYVICYK